MINQNIIEVLSDKKNLLAFSAGVDSSALFYILKESNINFDIAFVNYGLRKESIQEEKYTKELSIKYNINAFIINSPKWENNFEANARDFRYNFFHQIIDDYNYQTLITAHQLNDQLEWFLMRLTKGAGVSELLGLEDLSIRYTSSKNIKYNLIRPILDISKDD
ncbi:MAG: tRNA lysidine(34) synthetase TilS, partial [Sulfurovum sp.]|nr:tRNA lysidine(34) synthetase TilS [Sulfurovaceae bacterium]